jgi:hypothetical protein
MIQLKILIFIILIFIGFSMCIYLWLELKEMTSSKNQLRFLLEKREFEIERLAIQNKYENKFDTQLNGLPSCSPKSHYFNDNELVNNLLSTQENKEKGKQCIYKTKYVIAIKSGGKGSFEKRQLLRKTWISGLSNNSKYFFFLTRSQEDPALEENIQKVSNICAYFCYLF